MPTQEEYDKLHKELADMYRCSPRVVQYIRSSYYQRFKDVPLVQVKLEMIDHCDKVLVEIMRTYRQVKIDFASLVLKDITGLKQSNRVILKIQDELKHIIGFTDKVGFRKSIIGFLRHCSDEDFQAIIEAKVSNTA